MKTKYRIGLFIAIYSLVCVLSIGYYASYQNIRAKQNVIESKQESIATKGSASKNEGYYIAQLQGYLVVYLSDRTTIYEVTNISVDELPKQVREEIKEQKFVATEKELYAFLENYSS